MADATEGVAVSRSRLRSSCPAPCAIGSAAGSRWAVRVSSALSWSGVMPGRCWMTSAAAPETTAACPSARSWLAMRASEALPTPHQEEMPAAMPM